MHMRLTRAQKDAIERAAAAATLDASTWARMIVLRETDWTPEAELQAMQKKAK